ncbi:MAG: hypothetical protein CVU39_00790 [Chloroflexi bacterium HGW-Chloroflexi-10]|nr:MAG: hypothetical protein CVU39_00790 [Chloroflexi bacterium HGW-Chloroflexi-10]
MALVMQFSLSHLRSHWRVILAMVLMFALAGFVFFLLLAYRIGIENQFGFPNSQLLIVHEADATAELYGSRISTKIGVQLEEMGVGLAVPAIHAATGTADRAFQFIYGVDLEQYTQVESFRMLSGRSLQPGDAERMVMLGNLMARRLDAQVGDVVSLRGRPFNVVGIFETGKFTDNDAWISIAAAQALLGWGKDISYYLVPDEGILMPGENLGDSLIVTRQGDSMQNVVRQYQPLLNFFSVVVYLVGFVAAFTLTSVLLRLWWANRYDLAILRTLGFSKSVLSIFFLAQSMFILVSGFVLGLGGAQLLSVLYQLNVTGLTVQPVFNPKTILTGLGYLAVIIFAATLLPAWWISRINLAQMLRVE